LRGSAPLNTLRFTLSKSCVAISPWTSSNCLAPGLRPAEATTFLDMHLVPIFYKVTMAKPTRGPITAKDGEALHADEGKATRCLPCLSLVSWVPCSRCPWNSLPVPKCSIVLHVCLVAARCLSPSCPQRGLGQRKPR